MWHHTQREGVTGVTRVSQGDTKRWAVVQGGVDFSVGGIYISPSPKRGRGVGVGAGRSWKEIPCVPFLDTCPKNACAHRLAWNVLAYTHKSRLKNIFKLFLAKRLALC